MTAERLKTLVIRNFRSLRGEVVVPLDAQVILVHGTNGMGKTSVLSALELALTGKIAHLATDGNGYRSYLTTLETGGGSIELTTTGPLRDGARTKGTLDFSDTSFKPAPLTGNPASSFDTIDTALAQAAIFVGERVRAAEGVLAARVRALSELELFTKDQAQINVLKGELEATTKRLATIERAAAEVDTDREHAKKVSDAANRVRAGIVGKVFNTSLNKVWRDLFVRLAPSEQFVPQFQLPTQAGGKVEAVLETLHRSGKASGSPGAMLSQGNLNTAALTLFLALHLSVPSRFPWLVLDDPVQSMDDVHIAQFAALLRTLAKGMGRQLIVAVHERALFDYLTLELSPSFPGDSLISVEISKNFDDHAVTTPVSFAHQDDHLIAA